MFALSFVAQQVILRRAGSLSAKGFVVSALAVAALSFVAAQEALLQQRQEHWIDPLTGRHVK